LVSRQTSKFHEVCAQQLTEDRRRYQVCHVAQTKSVYFFEWLFHRKQSVGRGAHKARDVLSERLHRGGFIR